MRAPRPRYSPGFPRPPAVPLLLLLALCLALGAACGPGAAGTDEPLTEPVEATGEAPLDDGAGMDEPLISPGADPGEPETSQSDTAWGRIWDRLPDAFPLPPDSEPSEELPEGDPVSGVFSVPDEPSVVAAWMQQALERATYSTEALSGPFDDGSIVIDSVGEGECRIETTLRPDADATTVAIRYGAECPYD